MPASRGPIVVVGSVNMDLVCRVKSMPRPGETLTGSDFVTVPGGKGANQAVATAKLAIDGAPVHFVGRVGDDDFGERLENGLVQHKVNTDHLTVSEGCSSGVAMIFVDQDGENSIVVNSGANGKLTPRDIDAAKDLIASASAVLLQLEIPQRTVLHTIAMCQELGVFTILDPAPVDGKLPRAIFGVNVLVPNQTEAEMLLGNEPTARVRRKGIIDPKQIASDLLARGPRAVVLKLGQKGAMVLERSGEIEQIRPYKVSVVDTTAAGDAFAGALAVAHSEGRELLEAAHFANAAGALCCKDFGAQPSLPSRAAVEKLLKSRA